jgi:exonuclease III
LKNTNLTIIGNNCAGLTGKLDSLKRIIQVFHPGVVMIQETKLKKPGKIKLKEFIIFEKIRENNEGGGLMTMVHENMQPILIPDEHPEFLEVYIFGIFGSIRTINCYGPQENLSLEERTVFFIEMESRIISAKENQKLICIQFDANSKFGKNVIPGDPHEMSSNGKILFDILSRQNLIIFNSTDICAGVITRMKKTVRGVERSVLDYFVVCLELFQKIVKMTVDESRQYVLSRFYKYKTKTTTVESDHNPLILELNFKWNQKIKVDRKEFYNLRNIECQQIFKANTSNNPRLFEVIQNQDIIKGGAKWIKEVNHEISKSFKKIRVSNVKVKLRKVKSEDVKPMFNRGA